MNLHLPRHRGHGAPIRHRVLASLRRLSIDERLAGGADPSADPLSACRAGALLDLRHRRRLARGIRDIVARAERAPRPSSAVPIARASVQRNASTLLELAERLESVEPAGVRGVAAAELLLTDGDSPLWVASDPERLADRVQAALVGCETESQWA